MSKPCITGRLLIGQSCILMSTMFKAILRCIFHQEGKLLLFLSLTNCDFNIFLWVLTLFIPMVHIFWLHKISNKDLKTIEILIISTLPSTFLSPLLFLLTIISLLITSTSFLFASYPVLSIKFHSNLNFLAFLWKESHTIQEVACILVCISEHSITKQNHHPSLIFSLTVKYLILQNQSSWLQIYDHFPLSLIKTVSHV